MPDWPLFFWCCPWCTVARWARNSGPRIADPKTIGGAYDLYLYGWTVSTPDPECFLFPLYHSKSPDNFGRYGNVRVDELLDQARQPMDDARRLRLHRDATRLIVADVPAVFLFHEIQFAAHHVRTGALTLNLYGWPQDKLTTVEFR